MTSPTKSSTEAFWRLLRAYDHAEENTRQQEMLTHKAHVFVHDERIAESTVVAILVQVLGQRVAFHICVLAGQLSNNSTIGGQADVTFAVLRLP